MKKQILDENEVKGKTITEIRISDLMQAIHFTDGTFCVYETLAYDYECGDVQFLKSKYNVETDHTEAWSLNIITYEDRVHIIDKQEINKGEQLERSERDLLVKLKLKYEGES